VQYWHLIRDPDSWLQTLLQILKFNEGGLVVYGAIIAGLAWVLYFTQREQWSLLRTGDMIAPGMMLGLALGRIGCLLNGCCHGGACEAQWLAIHFPQGSPPYMSQLDEGLLLGAEFGMDERGLVVEGVNANGAAEAAGVVPGGRVLVLPSDKDLRNSKLLKDERAMVVIETPRNNARWTASELPSRSLPTRPAQIYSSINAALLCLLLIAWHPYRRRDGQLMLLMLTLYPITRFLLELVRTDESGKFGTALTISQWVSIGVLAAALIGWLLIQKSAPIATAPSQPTAPA
jgi:phosphatidylglycerol:prolipoprotein diacylglycerol transferase